ncbi:hypothetical protein EXN66_Car008307 [Channa argus]|uniref:Uncharacterized protein n=1 Tax=Channa argus TaxID=215402 RepID=A0A6G1PQL2_CHAAH|nr:hypothetical protein EXN66_Car008307 [Channa argus]
MGIQLTHYRRVCLSLCQGLVGKTKSACSSVSPQDTDYSSMSSRPGQGKSQPPRGRPEPQALLQYVSAV